LQDFSNILAGFHGDGVAGRWGRRDGDGAQQRGGGINDVLRFIFILLDFSGNPSDRDHWRGLLVEGICPDRQ
jgi:hypothetical protein